MTPVGQTTLPRIDSTLPAGDTRVGSKTVLEKVERTAGTQYTAQFGEGAAGIGDRAQGERRQGCVTAGIAEGDGLAVKTHVLDRDR
jgi:hypothetical protein